MKITALETIWLEEFPNLLWVEVHTVSLSPSQRAVVACGSIIACAWSGVV